jgi:curved DNA-binding protein CbpA
LAYKPTYYEILGVDHRASQQVIDHVYRNLQRAYHPDLHPENHLFFTEKIKLINEAHDTLANPEKRAEYDSLLARSLSQSTQNNIRRDFEVEENTDSNGHCSGCGRLLKGNIVNCPHCGTWISAQDEQDEQEEQQNSFCSQFQGAKSGARLVLVGIKIVKTGASLIGHSIFKTIGSASH